jgi:type III pantothenate kinase
MEWLALAIGNSRLHWAYCSGNKLCQAWHTDYFQPTAQWRLLALQDNSIPQNLPLYLASVVPAQTSQWQPFAQQVLTLADLPLHDLYPTLGIDRALAALGAGEKFGYPILVVDGGTALTITGFNADRRLVGGAIWPGLRLQLQALNQGTSALPNLQPDWSQVDRWATDTPGAIASGIFHSTLAGIKDFWQDWQQQFPKTVLVVTGGDGEFLYLALKNDLESVEYLASAVFGGMAISCGLNKT